MSFHLQTASYTAGSFQILFATTFTWVPPIVPPWTDSSLYLLYAWMNIFNIKSTGTNLTKKQRAEEPILNYDKTMYFCEMS
jgi:hypothetical protein